MYQPAAYGRRFCPTGFNLHLKTDDISQCRAVEKPSADGIVTSIAVFDAEQQMIVQFFGKRKPSAPELDA